ncbi:hypothetical protein EV426DRAFT_73447 [Tirmania nivea]|nr:hypothetical protein EV426DRAFT_73447 [Tirmania nivea]
MSVNHNRPLTMNWYKNVIIPSPLERVLLCVSCFDNCCGGITTPVGKGITKKGERVSKRKANNQKSSASPIPAVSRTENQTSSSQTTLKRTMCLITTPRANEEYIKETYIAPRPASTHSRRSRSHVYAYRDGTFSREYRIPVTPTVVRSDYTRPDYAPSIRSHRSHRQSSSHRSSQAYITAPPTSSARGSSRQIQYPTEVVPMARTETVYVTEEVEPTRIEVQPVQVEYPRKEKVENVYTARRVPVGERRRVYY